MAIINLLFFPGGLFLILLALAYEWVDRKLVAQLQNRIGPRWFQPAADILKLMVKEEITPAGAHHWLFHGLPVVALAGALTSALYIPLAGFPPSYSFPGDLVVTLYVLSLLTLSLGIAGSDSPDRFSLIGATRTLTQLFSYEAPFLLTLLGPALAARSWQISEINTYAQSHWVLLMQPIGFIVALVGLMGKLEMTPFDAPEAHTEIVAGAITEYSGRGLGLFRLSQDIELVVGLTLVAALYLGGISNPIEFFGKTLFLLLIIGSLQTLFARLRIDQTVGLWWRYGALLVLAQMLVLVGWEAIF